MRRVLFVLGLILAVGAAAQPRLVAGGRRATYGVHRPVPGRPLDVPLAAGGSYAARRMGIGDACRGHVALVPDAIVLVVSMAARMVIVVGGRGSDTTLVVHAPDDRWLCDDDGGDSTDPRLELTSAPAGQYDVWVGSYRAGETPQSTLRVTIE